MGSDCTNCPLMLRDCSRLYPLGRLSSLPPVKQGGLVSALSLHMGDPVIGDML